MQERNIDAIVQTVMEPARRLPATRTTARRHGLPLTVAELRTSVPRPPAQNAAPVYRQAFPLIDRQPAADGEALSAYLKANRTEGQRKAARGVLARSEAILRLAEKAASYPYCDFARSYAKGMETLFPEFKRMRQMGRLLAARGVTRLESGDTSGAISDIRATITIAIHAGQEQSLIPFLVRCALLSVADTAFRELLKRYGNRADVLNAAGELQRRSEGLTNPRNGLVAEVFMGVHAIDGMRRGKLVGEVGMEPLFSKFRDPQSRIIMCNAFETRYLEFWLATVPAMDRPGATLRTMHGTMQRVALEHERRVSTNPRDLSYGISAVMTPVFVQALEKAMQTEAMTRTRGVGIDLLRQRLTTGSFPATLPQTNRASDPFTDRTLLYRRSGLGFIVYSTSLNRGDDNGSETKDKRNYPSDIVFRYP